MSLPLSYHGNFRVYLVRSLPNRGQNPCSNGAVSDSHVDTRDSVLMVLRYPQTVILSAAKNGRIARPFVGGR